MKDSKIFCGMPIGTADKLQVSLKIFGTPPRQPVDFIDLLGWINMQLPKGVYLDVSYDYYGAPLSETYVHITLLDSSEYISLHDMKSFVNDKINLIGYGHVLGMLGIKYKKPKFYTIPFIY